ncbi:MAG: CRISPR-associated RAMP protein Csx7 [Cyanobacteria bacterium P01_A01_bin.84]
MFDTFKSRLEITGTLSTVTALLIGAGSNPEPTGSDLPVIKDALDRPYIPGSSFKGALRSRLESFLRGILGSDRTMVANPANNDEWSITSQEIGDLRDLNFEQLIKLENAKKDNRYKQLSISKLINDNIEELLTENELRRIKSEEFEDAVLTKIIIQHTDLISRLFGSPWLASKFQVRDLTVIAEDWFGQYQERDGVAIDRDTEIAADGKLYDFQVVPAGTSFEFKAVVENAEEWELGLLVIGLHQFESEQVPLGGGSSRGLGVVKLEIDRMKWFDYPADRPDFLLEYLQKLVKDDDSAYEDATDFKDQWVSELMEHLRQEISTKEIVNS